jgi:hypothetical protein
MPAFQNRTQTSFGIQRTKVRRELGYVQNENFQMPQDNLFEITTDHKLLQFIGNNEI